MTKHAAILEVAKNLFAHNGFAEVSMDRIAAEAGVSKLTIYSHFGDKETLFCEAIHARCREMLPDELFEINPDDSLTTQLKAIGYAFFSMLAHKRSVDIYRLMLSHNNLDDALKHLFWKAGPARTHAVFTNFLKVWTDNGTLEIPNLQRAAAQFFSLIKGELHLRIMTGLTDEVGPEELETHIDATVDFFLRAYRPSGATPPRTPDE